MKIMRNSFLIISTLVIMIQLLSCASFEIQFQPQAMKSRPKKILIGTFENRIVEHKPFIIKDFKDALRFEFLKRGYDVELLAVDGSKNTDNITCEENSIESYDAKEPQNSKINQLAVTKEAIQQCCKKYSSDMFINGSISIMETSELTDSKDSALISVAIYNNSGERVGEAYYAGSGRMDDAKTIKKISERFAGNIHSKLLKLRQK